MQPTPQNSDDHYVLIAPYIISLCLWKGRICENICICVCANDTLPNDLVLDIPRGSCMWLLFTARELIGKPCLSNRDYTQTKTIRDQILARIQLLSEPKDNMHYIKKYLSAAKSLQTHFGYCTIVVICTICCIQCIVCQKLHIAIYNKGSCILF